MSWPLVIATAGIVGLTLGWGSSTLVDRFSPNRAVADRCAQLGGIPFQPVTGGMVLCLRKGAVIDIAEGK